VLSFRRQDLNISSGNIFGPRVSVQWPQKWQNNLYLIAGGGGIEQFEPHLTPLKARQLMFCVKYC